MGTDNLINSEERTLVSESLITDNINNDNKNIAPLKNDDKNNIINKSKLFTLDNDNDEKDTEYNPLLERKIDYKIGCICLILTVALLFPYSSIIASLDYFTSLYPNYHCASTFPFVYMVMLNVSFLIILKYSNKIKHHINIIIGYLVFILTMATIPTINLLSNGGIGIYIITVLLMAITSICDGLLQSSIYALSSMFGPQYSVFCEMGIGLSGVIVIIIRFIIKIALRNSNEDYSIKADTVIFFSVGAVMVLISMGFFISLLFSPLGKKIMKKDNNHNNSSNNNISSNSINYELNPIDSIDDNISTLTRSSSSSSSSLAELSSSNLIIDDNKINKNNNNDNEILVNQSPLKYVFLANKHYVLITVLLFTVSLFLYPSIVIQQELFKPKGWYILTVVAIYNISDFIGKAIPLFLKKNHIGIKYIWAITAGRCIFILVFFLQISIQQFRISFITYSFLFLFSISNGYISSICMAQAPMQVKTEYKELSGIVMSFSTNIGLLLGASLNLLVTLLQ